jgi:DinB superfamily
MKQAYTARMIGTNFFASRTHMNHPRIIQCLFLVLFALVGTATTVAEDSSSGGMTRAERTYLLTLLQSSEASFTSSIKGLTEAQWTYKPSPDSWSIQECAEHLILAEDLIFNESQKVLKTAAVARLSNATSEGDRQIVDEMEDRSKKAKAPKVLQPKDSFPTPDSAIKEFQLRRDKTISYVKTTIDPVRIHVGDGPTGSPADVYQFLLELAAHSVRHTAQIREVKSAPGYPSRALTKGSASYNTFPGSYAILQPALNLR